MIPIIPGLKNGTYLFKITKVIKIEKKIKTIGVMTKEGKVLCFDVTPIKISESKEIILLKDKDRNDYCERNIFVGILSGKDLFWQDLAGLKVGAQFIGEVKRRAITSIKMVG